VNEINWSKPATELQRAPLDGSVINVEFSNGEITQVQWDLDQQQWKLPHPDGNVFATHDARHEVPEDWWPVLG
jgi:hypothetical protein